MTQIPPVDRAPSVATVRGFDLDLSFLPAGYDVSVRRFARFGVALLLVIITVGSLAPPEVADLSAAGIGDKTAHLAGYGGTMLCAAFAAGRVRVRWGWGVFLLFYGALMEWGQAALAQGRQASLGDMAANGAGIIAGGLSAMLIVRLGHFAAKRKALSRSRV